VSAYSFGSLRGAFASPVVLLGVRSFTESIPAVYAEFSASRLVCSHTVYRRQFEHPVGAMASYCLLGCVFARRADAQSSTAF